MDQLRGARGSLTGWRRDRSMAAWARDASSRREAIKVRYGGLFAEATSLFFEVDPAGVNYESNRDEYEPEVGTVLPRLEQAASVEDVRRILREELDRWFYDGLCPDERVDRLGAELWRIWVAWKRTVAS